MRADPFRPSRRPDRSSRNSSETDHFPPRSYPKDSRVARTSSIVIPAAIPVLAVTLGTSRLIVLGVLLGLIVLSALVAALIEDAAGNA